MKNRNLERRSKVLKYEVGQLPDYLLDSTLYWSLPYEIRRFLYLKLSPIGFQHVHRLRSLQPEDLNVPTLKPFHDTQSIFVHVPKSAGISVGFSLYGRKTGDHRTMADYKLCFTKNEFKSFFKFAFVRNPWDRLLSAYLYMKKGGRNKQDYDWAKKHLSPYNSFDEFVTNWVNRENIHLGLHFRPQYEFLCVNGTRPEVDFIGHFENITDDYEYIRNKIGAGNELAAYNRTADKSRDYRQHYNDNTIAIVESVYREDIHIFGYDFYNISLKSRLTLTAPDYASNTL